MKKIGSKNLTRKLVTGMQIGATTFSALLLLCLLVAFILPLIFSLLPLFPQWSLAGGVRMPGDTSPPVLSLIFSPTVLKIASRTLALAFFSTLLALFAGIPAAFFTSTRSFPGRRFLLSLSAVPLCLPPLLVALGYVMFWGMQGVANSAAAAVLGTNEPAFTFLYSPVGIVLAQGFYNFPLVMKTCSDSWSQLPTNQRDAALLLGASPLRVFRTITLVQLLPAIATSAMVVFLYCFFSFVIVLVFGGVGVTVLEVEIYQAARSRLNFPLAASLALVETLLALLVVAGYSLVEGRGKENKGLAWDEAGFSLKKIGGWKEGTGFTLLVLVIGLFFFLPLLQLLVSAFTARLGSPHQGGNESMGSFFSNFSLKNFSNLFSRPSFYLALKNTLISASLSSVVAVIGALFYSLLLKEWSDGKLASSFFAKRGAFIRKNSLGLGRILPLLPMAVSSVVLAIGATSLTTLGLPALRGSPWMLVLLQAALHWPLAFRQIYGALDKIPDSTRDAAKILSPFPLDKVFRVYLPLCRKKILASLGFCFALGCGDTTLPLVLAIPRFETLALYTYNLAGAYRFYEACCSGVILAILTMPIFFFGEKPLMSKRRSFLRRTNEQQA